MRQVPTYLFILSVLLIFAAFYIGVSTDAKTIFAGINTLGNTFTGRNAAGQFASYPQGAAVPLPNTLA